jgi:CelD/BcsL family acetyltransferase involved in cellulose biosynthesis
VRRRVLLRPAAREPPRSGARRPRDAGRAAGGARARPPEGWEATYRAKTSSKRRNLYSRGASSSRARARSPCPSRRTAEELAAAIEEAFVLHAKRWQNRPDASDFGTAVGRDFHRRVVAALARERIPRIVTLRLDGRPVAFHYFFLLENRMYVHRLAFDPEFARFSPGQLNTLDALEVGAGSGAGLVEFLGGDERYKLELADRLDPLVEAVGLADGAYAKAVARGRCAWLVLRRRLKQSELVRTVYRDRLGPVHRVVRRTSDAVRGMRARQRS